MQLRVWINGIEFTSSTLILNMRPTPVDPVSCSISSSGTMSAETGSKSSFLIYSRDKFGNPRTPGDDSFVVRGLGQDGKYVFVFFAKLRY